VFSLCLVTDRKQLRKNYFLPGIVKAAVAGGANAVMLREKDIENTSELLYLAKKIKKAAGQAVFIVNGRCDIALAAGAGGVHLTSASIPVKAARKIIGRKLLLGKSCHSIKDALKAEKEGVDYVFIGPVYFTASKEKYGKPLGTEMVGKLKKKLKIPVIAIGGIKAENAGEVLAAGADGLAIISGILKAKKPGMSTSLYRQALGKFGK